MVNYSIVIADQVSIELMDNMKYKWYSMIFFLFYRVGLNNAVNSEKSFEFFSKFSMKNFVYLNPREISICESLLVIIQSFKFSR